MSKLWRGKILIVEDDAGLVETLPVFLERFLFSVRIVTSVEAAKKELVLDHFDVLVLDWILPDGAGREVMNFAREVVPEIGIVVYSAHESSDSECTPLADDFVEKGQDVLALKNAVDRCMRLAKERLGWIRIPCDKDDSLIEDSIAQSIVEMFDVSDFGRGPYVVTSESELLSSKIAKYLFRLCVSQDAHILEVNLNNESGRTPYSRLFGECRVQVGKVPSLQKGILDSPIPSCVLVRNAQYLTDEDSEALARCVATKTIRRIGSERDIFSDFKLILTVHGNPGEDPFEKIGERLRGVIGNRVMKVPSPRELPGGIKATALFCQCQSTKEPRVLNPGIEKLLEAGVWGDSWGIMPQFSSSPMSDDCVVESEKLVFSMFESAIVRQREGKTEIAKWKDLEIIPRAIYVCRVLSETKGNLAEASRLSGMRRNAIYDILKHFGIDLDRFRSRPVLSQPDPSVRTSRFDSLTD